ncbi:nucleotidyltransferase family protein [Pyrinomonas methylaliphatogenes]|uniref:Uncharacterized MobA-like protein n=1 Tax=Pyrinomonas methylaliphatogenes TaxID=454194 RepID=A0A0B6X058_9BACT|nr:nucleotidyltransferase family protein [Pyrinomonas methylaliphatogenes]MBX5478366.1 nucleotidyltransferase family protein [Pyrinomonas methylaliphatogenes]CDM66711.1 uncharacterized MobA-like protein [Pyrinomonas methylaliphatogenes]
MRPKIGIIILAAGRASRMGNEPKQLLKLRGKTLLRRAVEAALRTELRTIVVLGAQHEACQREIEDLPIKIAINEDWPTGISSSLKKGISVSMEEELDGAIIMLCDQPRVTSETLLRLRDAFIGSKKPIAACSYGSAIGAPALFGRETFVEFATLQGDEGAKKLIAKDLTRATIVNAPEAAFDIDTYQDFQRLANEEVRDR